MSILYPIVSFYMINPGNLPLEGLYYPKIIAEKFRAFTMYQIMFVFSCSIVGSILFRNPPSKKSALSKYWDNWSKLSSKKEELVISVHGLLSVGNRRVLFNGRRLGFEKEIRSRQKKLFF